MAVFGREIVGGGDSPNIDVFRGGIFTCYENGTADSITAYLQAGEPGHNVKAAIYAWGGDSPDVLVGYTEEVAYAGGWQTMNCVGSPALVENTVYALVVWSELAPSRVAVDAGGASDGAWDGNETAYGNWPDPAVLEAEANLVSIYCTYTPTTPTARKITLVESMKVADWMRLDPQGAKAQGFLLTSGSQV